MYHSCNKTALFRKILIRGQAWYGEIVFAARKRQVFNSSGNECLCSFLWRSTDLLSSIFWLMYLYEYLHFGKTTAAARKTSLLFSPTYIREPDEKASSWWGLPWERRFPVCLTKLLVLVHSLRCPALSSSLPFSLSLNLSKMCFRTPSQHLPGDHRRWEQAMYASLFHLVFWLFLDYILKYNN